MVVSIEFLNVIKLSVILIFGVLIFVKRNETPGRHMHLIASFILLVINVFQIPMQVQIGKSYTRTIILVFLWFVDALFAAYDLGKNS